MRQAVSLCDSPIVGDYLAEIMLLFAPAVGLGCAIFLPIDHSGGHHIQNVGAGDYSTRSNS